MIILYVGLIISGFIVVNSFKSPASFTWPEDITRSFTITKIVPVEKDKIFQLMSDVEIYTTVLVNNVKNVQILNQTENTVGDIFRYAEIEVEELGISTSFVVYQEITGTEKNFLQIKTGDAQGTEITQIFKITDSGTKITNQVIMKVKGILIVFGIVPSNNIEHAMSTIISSFVDFTKN